MKSIKVIVREYTTKEGKKFITASCKGRYLPFATAEVDTRYTIKFANGGAINSLPNKEGIYEIAYNDDKSIWIDKRPEVAPKHIVRVKVERILFKENLKTFEQLTEEQSF